MKKIIYDEAGCEHVVGTAGSWIQVYEVCDERGLSVASVGSEGPDAFYISPPPRRTKQRLPASYLNKEKPRRSEA